MTFDFFLRYLLCLFVCHFFWFFDTSLNGCFLDISIGFCFFRCFVGIEMHFHVFGLKAVADFPYIH